MHFVINELSFIGQANTNYEADDLMKVLLDVVKELEPIRGDDPIQVHSSFARRKLSVNLMVKDWLYEKLKSASPTDKDRLVSLVTIMTKWPFIDKTLDDALAFWECHFNQQDVSGSSLAGAAYLKATLISLQKSPEFADEYILVIFSTDGNNYDNIEILNLTTASKAKKLRPRYVPSPKHAPGGWGTLMDITDEEAQAILDTGIASGKQIYAYYQGKYYEFQDDNAGGFHGYPVDSREVPADVIKRITEEG
ncbi:MAG: hypothetical protein Fur0025_26530 [Oscillatoriaceae cyanobacterium]